MRKLFLFLTTLLFFSFTKQEWTPVHSSSGVIISYKQADCVLDNSFKQRWFLLHFKNTSNKKVKVEWNIQLFDENEKCVTCDDVYGEHKYSLVLLPGEVKQGECSFSNPTELHIVSKLLDITTSMSYPTFKLTDIKISEVK